MSNDYHNDISAIREWLAKESYLPQNFDDLIIRKFLHSCYGSLEQTKKCIDRFCTARSVMKEIYTDRDPCSKNMDVAFSITSVSSYQAGENEILIHQIDDPTLDSYVFYDVLKSFTLVKDYWLRYQEFLPEGHIIIFDIKDYTLKILPKVNVMYYRDFLIFLLESMPVRVKQVHAVNCPSYYEKLYSLIKPVLPAEIRDMITFHAKPEGLHKYIDKKYLPQEFGGEAESMKNFHKTWVQEIKKDRDWYLDDSMWKANLHLKPKTNTLDSTMTGSFRTLSID